MRADIKVPRDLSSMSRAELKNLRDRLIAAGIKEGKVDDRLKMVVMALRTAQNRPEKEKNRRQGKPRSKDANFRFGSIGSVAGDKLRRMKRQAPKGKSR